MDATQYCRRLVMNATNKVGILATLALLSLAPLRAANSQEIRQIYSGAAQPIIEQDYASIKVVPMVLEQNVLVRQRSNFIENESSLPRRSNYSKRLGDLLEQLTFAYDRGWLDQQQFQDFKNWQANVAMEELLLREQGNGIVPRTSVEQMERHLNGLAYTINQQIDAGSKLAGRTESVY
jgi:hypothetical protein